MYSHEIQAELQRQSYVISSIQYINICKNSSQIKIIKYNPYSNLFFIETDDGYSWNFTVKPEENYEQF